MPVESVTQAAAGDRTLNTRPSTPSTASILSPSATYPIMSTMPPMMAGERTERVVVITTSTRTAFTSQYGVI